MNHLIFLKSQHCQGNELHRSSHQYEVRNFDQLEHLNKVLKVKIGQKFKAILIAEGLCVASCLEIKENSIIFELNQFKEAEKRTFDLLIGLARPQSLKKVLEYAAGQPVGRIHFFKAELSEKSYSTSKIFDLENLNKILHQGLSQCGRFDTIPDITIHTSFPNELISNYQNKYILSLKSKTSITGIPSIEDEHFTSPPLFAFGPERGFTDSELNKFESLGFHDILLSKSILRVETAVIALCAQLELLSLDKK